jgi:hypothetical protein
LPKRLRSENLALDPSLFDGWVRDFKLDERLGLEPLTQLVERQSDREVCCGRSEHVAGMKRCRHRAQHDVRGRDRNGARRAFCGVPERREQSIVRSDEQTSVAGFDSDVAIAADRWIDHC